MRASLLLFSCICLLIQGCGSTQPTIAEVVRNSPLLNTHEPSDFLKHFSEQLSVEVKETESFSYIQRRRMNPYGVYRNAAEYCKTVYGGEFVRNGALRIMPPEAKPLELVALTTKYGITDFETYELFRLGAASKPNSRNLLPHGRVFYEELSEVIGYPYDKSAHAGVVTGRAHVRPYYWREHWEHGSPSNSFNHSCMVMKEQKFVITVAEEISERGRHEQYYLAVSKPQLIEDFYSREIKYAVSLGKVRMEERMNVKMNEFEYFEYEADLSTAVIGRIKFWGYEKDENPNYLAYELKNNSSTPTYLNPLDLAGGLMKVDGNLYTGVLKKVDGQLPFRTTEPCLLLDGQKTILLNPGAECKFFVSNIEVPSVDFLSASSIAIVISDETYPLKKIHYKDTLNMELRERNLIRAKESYERNKAIVTSPSWKS